ncbi:MAG: Hint domain-containing protein [Proteobacteria bacterium]|nr:Hint domain-containing protein [Pseudomonadota bacterium]MBS0574069.1 Hint domain-containing protein [Pseudomonadota bacterium]
MITTLGGEKSVEELCAGDRIVTRDNGLQTLRRVFRRDYDYGQLAIVPHLQPVLVTAGALDKGLPERDMLCSPNLRLLVRPDRLPFGVPEAPGLGDALVPVKHLCGGRAVRTCAVLGVGYILVEFDRHEVILANGCWVEAFCLGDPSLGARGNAQRTEIHEIFPDRRPVRPLRRALET